MPYHADDEVELFIMRSYLVIFLQVLAFNQMGSTEYLPQLALGIKDTAAVLLQVIPSYMIVHKDSPCHHVEGTPL